MQTPKFRIFAHQVPPLRSAARGGIPASRPPLAATAGSWPLYHTLFANFELQAVKLTLDNLYIIYQAFVQCKITQLMHSQLLRVS